MTFIKRHLFSGTSMLVILIVTAIFAITASPMLVVIHEPNIYALRLDAPPPVELTQIRAFKAVRDTVAVIDRRQERREAAWAAYASLQAQRPAGRERGGYWPTLA